MKRIATIPQIVVMQGVNGSLAFLISALLMVALLILPTAKFQFPPWIVAVYLLMKRIALILRIAVMQRVSGIVAFLTAAG
jgi:hypothetical protein